MTGTCPHLEARRVEETQTFETERAYCGVAESFVEPMRADICRARYDLEPRADCEIYRDHHGED